MAKSIPKTSQKQTPKKWIKKPKYQTTKKEAIKQVKERESEMMELKLNTIDIWINKEKPRRWIGIAVTKSESYFIVQGRHGVYGGVSRNEWGSEDYERAKKKAIKKLKQN